MSMEAVQRGPKFRRRAEARPDEVLDAALDLFIEKGFAATRVEDIANAVLFLCTEDSRNMTGQCLTVDGGWDV